MATKSVLAGIRATGRLHLGNYLGAIKGMIDLQNDPNYQTYYMVADMHAVTTPFDPAELQANRREVILDYLAAGLDPEKSVLFLQSDIQLHGELAFYLSSLVTVARMQHLPTFKEKVKQTPEDAKLALLNYPVLMAADILAYKAAYVPVGQDQEPHMEVAREIARKLNEQYHLDFPEPQTYFTTGKYVPSLTGEGKMSKSVPNSYIELSDDLDTIKKRLAAAPTDSGTGSTIPERGGVANLLTLVELFQGPARKAEYEAAYVTTGLRYGDLKNELASAIYAELQPFQTKRAQLQSNPDYVDQVITDGTTRARERALATLHEIRTAFGLA